MTPSFQDLVEGAVAHLAPRPRIIYFEEFDSFDNAIAILEDGAVRWRLLRERSDVGVQASSSQDPEEWYDIATTESLLGVTEPASSGYPQRTLEAAVRRIARLRSELQRLFGPDWTVTRRSLKRSRMMKRQLER